jgi:hypothetical protein
VLVWALATLARADVPFYANQPGELKVAVEIVTFLNTPTPPTSGAGRSCM